MSARSAGHAANSPTVLAGLAEIIRQVIGRSTAEVQLDRLFVADLGVDSLSMVEIVVGTAVHFGVPIEDEAVKTFARVGDLVEYVGARMGRSQTG